MANMHLVTGYAGREHVTAADQGAFHAAMFGSGDFVLGSGNQLAASIVSNNQVRVLDGDIYMQGRFIRLDKDTYIDLVIENGTQGYSRNDLIVARYAEDQATAIEEVNLVVIKGEAVMENPEDPAYTTGDILVAGDMLHDMPLYRVVIDGLNLVELVPLFSVYGSNLQKKQERTELLEERDSLSDSDHFPVFDAATQKHKKVLLSKIKDFLANTFAAKSHEHAADDITSGILSIARGGTGVESIDALASLLGAARIEVGSYVGTGTYGESNPCSITASFEIKAVGIITIVYNATSEMSSTNNAQGQLWMSASALPTTYKIGNGLAYEGTLSYSYAKKSEDGKTVSWYHTKSAIYQCNLKNYTYYYIVFG